MTTATPRTLLESHTQALAARGVSRVTAEGAGLHSETDMPRLQSMLNRKRISRKIGGGIVIPYIGIDGERNGFARVRLDVPLINQKGGQDRYLSPSGSSSRVYFPPAALTDILSAESELIVTEGEFKSLSLSEHGFPAIGLGGVHGWCTKGKADNCINVDLELIPWNGRNVYIVFDSDAITNVQVLDAERRLSAQLAKRGAKVRICRLPNLEGLDKTGADDFLVRKGSVELRKRLDQSVEPEEVQGETIRIAASDLDSYPEARRFIDETSTFRNGQVEARKMQFYRGEYHRWVGGRYVRKPDEEIRAAVVKWLDTKVSKITGGVVSNLMQCIKAECMLSSQIEQPTWLSGSSPWLLREILATSNGLVHLPSFAAGMAPESYWHFATPHLFTPNALEFGFDPDAPKPLKWLQFLAELWANDQQAIDALQEWFGYCLTPDTSQQKILLVVGPRRSGKGTIARVLHGLIGSGNVAGPTLAGLATQFGLWPLLDKSVGIVSDARLSGRTDTAVVTERLLCISGEDRLTIDRKCLDPVDATLPTRLVILTNEIPRMGDSSGALVGRMIVLPLHASFYGNEDTGLTERLLTELPGVLLWAIEGWKRLRERGHFIQPESGADLLGEMEDLSSPIGQFIKEWCVIDPDRNVTIPDLYRAWCRWCVTKGRKEHGTEQTFGRDLRTCQPALQVSQPRICGVRTRVYNGIGLDVPAHLEALEAADAFE